ncbi:hypothetical protein ASE95_10450 [Sphingomonas sp. Leaf231]|uniref:hypothetical protein n=1 Tax=Sphingomonas sp. Leaf231 TaxID=1736301 RepID=UPI0006FB0783|nr:hypothetical protein [Sphingomonas sp. Leaf231]KQN93003.1 hypothetical protein ASE95_10450 [Sphingomonas sp. Leaf231]
MTETITFNIQWSARGEARKRAREYAALTVDEYCAAATQMRFSSNRLAIIDGRLILVDADLAG